MLTTKLRKLTTYTRVCKKTTDTMDSFPLPSHVISWLKAKPFWSSAIFEANKDMPVW